MPSAKCAGCEKPVDVLGPFLSVREKGIPIALSHDDDDCVKKIQEKIYVATGKEVFARQSKISKGAWS